MSPQPALKDFIIGLRHIGVVVDDIEQTVAAFSRIYGFDADSVRVIPETLTDDTPARFAFLTLGETEFEIIQFNDEGLRAAHEASPSGSGGINHVAWQVSDLDACMRTLAEIGIGPGHVTPDGPFAYEANRFVYLDPAACDGLLIELVETRADHS